MPKDLPRLLDVEELASKLRVSKTSVLRLASSGQIPSMKIGGKRMFAEHDVWVYLQGLRRKSLADAKERNHRLSTQADDSQLPLNAPDGAVDNTATH